jgi:hypothetical protein
MLKLARNFTSENIIAYLPKTLITGILLTFFLDLEVDAQQDAPLNDEVFEEEGGETVGNTAVGPRAPAVSNFSMRP